MNTTHLMRSIHFGKELIQTQDLDPIYTFLVHSNMNYFEMSRWCLAYWCFYHAGTASWCSEEGGLDFFRRLRLADEAKMPRGTERRHFRGEKSRRSIEWLSQQKKSAADLVDWIFETSKYSEIAERVQQIPQFGPWIAWKVADMGERVLGFTVDFSGTSLNIYKDPKQGAALIFTGDWRSKITTSQVHDVVYTLLGKFRGFKAPPARDRDVNIQEVETILCKYKAHVKGHYPMGRDTREILEGGLIPKYGKTAMVLREVLRKHAICR